MVTHPLLANTKGRRYGNSADGVLGSVDVSRKRGHPVSTLHPQKQQLVLRSPHGYLSIETMLFSPFAWIGYVTLGHAVYLVMASFHKSRLPVGLILGFRARGLRGKMIHGPGVER
jgi:hypothetical protein